MSVFDIDPIDWTDQAGQILSPSFHRLCIEMPIYCKLHLIHDTLFELDKLDREIPQEDRFYSRNIYSCKYYPLQGDINERYFATRFTFSIYDKPGNNFGDISNYSLMNFLITIT